MASPLVPDDYVEFVNPLWCRRQMWGRVEAVRRETADAATLTIRPGRGWPEHRAGQHVGIAAQVAGAWRRRLYSVSSPPGRADGRFQITVKAARDGRVSPRLVHATTPGVTLRLDPPAGDFVLPETVPERLFFLTAGSGITPVMAMLRDLASRHAMPDVVIVHVAPSPTEVIFGSELRALADRFPRLRLYERYTGPGACASGPGGRPCLTEILEACPDWQERSAWACGPAALLDDAEVLWGERGGGARLRVERFQLATAAPGSGGSVRFLRSDRRVAVNGGTPLLTAGEDAGVQMPSGCRIGICRGCAVRLGAGRVRDLRTGVEYGEVGDLVQTCVSTAVGEVHLDL
jgi:ferredoxin-NADP reductase